MKNILGIEVTKPDNQLIIMSGPSGSGKSTKARELVFNNNGVIYSTDTTIENEFGNYNKFFQEMNEKNDFSNLHKAHQKTLRNAKIAIDSNVPYIIIDNTNIKPWEPKEYVIHALKQGYADENIKFINIDVNELTPEMLFERNLHNVPMDKIRGMYDSYKFHSPLTLEKVINSKNPYENKILYSAVVLTEESRSKLLEKFYDSLDIPEDIQLFAHHMTIIFGKELPEHLKQDLNKQVELYTTHVGISDTNLAVKVEGYYSTNKIPHITVSVKNGGKPVMSNDIENWVEMERIELKGIVKEIIRN